MAYLQEYEWMIINDIAYNISYIYSFQDMEKEVLECLKKVVYFDGGVLAQVEIKSANSIKVKNPSFVGVDEKTKAIWETQIVNCDLAGWLILSGRNNAFSDNELYPEESWISGSLYKQFYVPNDFYYSMSMSITFKGETLGIIKLYRSKKREPFQARDLFAIDMLQKHFSYRFSYEARKGDTRYFYAKGYTEEICRKNGFTEREADVYRLVIDGCSNEEIACQLNVSIHTVKKHLQNMYQKMGIKNRVQLLQGLPLSSSKIDLDEIW
ncbi:MAG: helix-turn-helix transcriptional regulator [Anaerovoracaceae bacterium]|nr:helix-turn-helix transcriptional regulator [Anaerovoracaceae bacterium]